MKGDSSISSFTKRKRIPSDEDNGVSDSSPPAPPQRLVINIPPPTSSRRNLVVTRPRSNTPSSSSESEECSSDETYQSRKLSPKKNKQAKRMRVDSVETEGFEPSDSGNDTLFVATGGKGKSFDPPPAKGSMENDTVPSGHTFIPEGIKLGELSRLNTKYQQQIGATALRHPLNFFDRRAVEMLKDSIPKVSWLPIGQKSKPAVRHVNARVVQVADPQDEQFCEETYTEPYSHFNTGPTTSQAAQQSALQTSPEYFLQTNLPIAPPSPSLGVPRQEDASSSTQHPSTSSPNEKDTLESAFLDLSLSAAQWDRVDSALCVSNATENCALETTEDWLQANSHLSCHVLTPPGMEISDLAELQPYLKQAYTTSISSKSDIIFVHKTQLQELSLRSGLLRAKELKPVFILFETDSSQKIWNVDEVYPFGGIITFTTKALTSNVDLLMQKIHEVAMHPLWEAYIVPSVLGLAIKNYYGDIRIWDSLDDSFAFAELLNMLDDGVIRLTSDRKASNDCWNLQQELRILNHEEIVKFCVGAAPARAIEQDSAFLEVNEEVADVLQTLQIQPRFYKRYRRFVVLSEGFEKIPDEGSTKESVGLTHYGI
ncbi:hypothetical protein F5876DRAFT_61860 [Lentinula aff. lateritia]|uniref:Uncharacterized protein n=1 Tax=Lentinula aff. lateritia TaxID=2804960 RepID=A0ACC1UDV8_9AGAR|nr:hypothetical protein F5876DRAFT_61860 [Lentinula aff. lateritia]